MNDDIWTGDLMEVYFDFGALAHPWMVVFGWRCIIIASADGPLHVTPCDETTAISNLAEP